MATAVNYLKELAMNRDRLRQSFAFLLIGLVMFAFVSVSWAAMLNGVKVEVPYAVTNAQWWTGVAIKNLDASSATDPIRINFFDQEGVFMGTVDIGSLEPLEIYSQTASTIYPGTLPSNYSIMISQPGGEELAVTVFVGNSATGGFAFQTYNSQVTATPSWYQILSTVERFELVMNNEAVLDRETGLVWQRDTSDTVYNWTTAHTICYMATIGGRKGWRLPTIDELATLVDPTEFSPSLPDGHPFTNVKSNYYWSSTPSATYPDIEAWLASFSNGYFTDSNKGNSTYVRAVRSGQ